MAKKPQPRTSVNGLDSIFADGRNPTHQELQAYWRYAGTVPVETLVNTMGTSFLTQKDADAYVAYFKRIHP